MSDFWKAVAVVLVAVILGVFLQQQRKEIGLLLIILVCAMVSILAVSYLKPVISFLQKLQGLGNLDPQMLSIMLKATGIGLITQISSAICQDSGNGTLAKGLQILGSSVVVWMSLPLWEELIALLQKLLEGI